jgi:hypothetical protein
MFAATFLDTLGTGLATGLARPWLSRRTLLPAGVAGLCLLAAFGVVAYRPTPLTAPCSQLPVALERVQAALPFYSRSSLGSPARHSKGPTYPSRTE